MRSTNQTDKSAGLVDRWQFRNAGWVTVEPTQRSCKIVTGRIANMPKKLLKIRLIGKLIREFQVGSDCHRVKPRVHALYSFGYAILPRNTLEDCQLQCEGAANAEACQQYCECIHVNGKTIGDCMVVYDQATEND